VLPTRFFDPADDPGGDGAGEPTESDLYYDGESFVLFEAPHIRTAPMEGASGAFSVATVASLMAGADCEDALRSAKAYVTDAIRFGEERDGRRILDLEAAAAAR
jgi:hydroxymethylpyrimidine/phosphomethylpyrimidine kinase